MQIPYLGLDPTHFFQIGSCECIKFKAIQRRVFVLQLTKITHQFTIAALEVVLNTECCEYNQPLSLAHTNTSTNNVFKFQIIDFLSHCYVPPFDFLTDRYQSPYGRSNAQFGQRSVATIHPSIPLSFLAPTLSQSSLPLATMFPSIVMNSTLGFVNSIIPCTPFLTLLNICYDTILMKM